MKTALTLWWLILPSIGLTLSVLSNGFCADAASHAHAVDLVKSASVAYTHNDYAKVEALCKQAIQADPEYARAHLWLGTAYEAEGNKGDAVWAFRDAINLAPATPDADLAARELHKLLGADPLISIPNGLACSERTGDDWGLDSIKADGTRLNHLSAGISDRPPSWSPGGARLAFTAPVENKMQIFSVGADGSNRTQLTEGDADNFDPAWSPDGQKIAFVSTRDGNDQIYVMGANGGNPTRLIYSSDEDTDPAWSPMGQQILFSRGSIGNPASSIYMMQLDEGETLRLTYTPGHHQRGSFSADSMQILFQGDRSGAWQIYVLDCWVNDPDGSCEKQLTNSAAGSENPAWSPDGAAIAFDTVHDKDRQIYLMKSDGSAPTRITAGPPHAAPCWSPVGSSSSTQENLGLGLMFEKRYAEAELALRQALQQDPDNPVYLINLARALEAQKKWSDATNLNREAAEREPGNPGLYSAIWADYSNQNRESEAEAAIKEAILLEPKSGIYLYQLGLVMLAEGGRWAEMEACERQAVRLQPDAPFIHNDLGTALYHQNRFKEAQAEVESAVQLDPHNESLRDALRLMINAQK